VIRVFVVTLIAALVILTGLASLLSGKARAETTRAWGYLPSYQSTITLQPTEAPGAVAEVEFINRTVHSTEDVTFALDLGGLTVMVDASVGRGMTPDRMTVTPPSGFIAVPPEIDVPEDEAGVVLILPWVGM
jgi:hypothetical protein